MTNHDKLRAEVEDLLAPIEAKITSGKWKVNPDFKLSLENPSHGADPSAIITDAGLEVLSSSEWLTATIEDISAMAAVPDLIELIRKLQAALDSEKQRADKAEAELQRLLESDSKELVNERFVCDEQAQELKSANLEIAKLTDGLQRLREQKPVAEVVDWRQPFYSTESDEINEQLPIGTKLYAEPKPAVDVEAIREVIADLREYIRIGQEGIERTARRLARAIGDET